jgi:endoglucanase
MPHVLWGRNYKSIIDQIKSMGFNCIRLPLSADINGSTMPQSLATYFNPDLNGLTTLQLLIKVVDYAGSVGVYVFLDCHRLTSGAGTDSAISSDTLSSIVSFWQLMATTFKDHPAVCGADLYNEPYTVDWPTLAGFYSTIGNAIHAIAPNWLIICEGDTNYNGVSYWWGGQLAGAASNPVSLTLPNKLVYSAHDYAHSVGQQQWLKSTSNPNVDNWPDNLPAIWDAAWGYLVKNGTAPVIIGEFGGKFGWDTSGNVDVSQPDAAYEKQWLAQLIAYMNTNGVSATYWTFTSQSGDTGGLLQGDDLTPQSGKLTLLQGFLS